VPRRREIPLSPLVDGPGRSDGVARADSALESRAAQGAHGAAYSEVQALMETAPGETPRSSTEGLLPLRDLLSDAIDALDPRERWIFDATVVERKSIREVGRELNLAKSWVDRLKQRAVANLREALATEPIILAYLERTAT